MNEGQGFQPRSGDAIVTRQDPWRYVTWILPYDGIINPAKWPYDPLSAVHPSSLGHPEAVRCSDKKERKKLECVIVDAVRNKSFLFFAAPVAKFQTQKPVSPFGYPLFFLYSKAHVQIPRGLLQFATDTTGILITRVE